MNRDLKSEITLIQIQCLRAIKSHQVCYEKLKEGGEEYLGVNEELQLLQKIIKDCQDRQRILLESLRSENGQVYHFDFFKVPVNTEQGKKRRRKDLSLQCKSEKQRSPSPVTVKSRSPSPARSIVQSSDSGATSEDSDEDDARYPSSLPMLLPLARTARLGNGDSMPISKYARSVKHEKSRRMIRSQQTEALKETDAELFRAIPNIPERPPTPEPINDTERKKKYVAALNLIPKEMLPELLNRKVERKRRSTANAQFVYNDDWEYPKKRKSQKQYLSPVKPKMSILKSSIGSPSIILNRCDDNTKSPEKTDSRPKPSSSGITSVKANKESVTDTALDSSGAKRDTPETASVKLEDDDSEKGTDNLADIGTGAGPSGGLKAAVNKVSAPKVSAISDDMRSVGDTESCGNGSTSEVYENGDRSSEDGDLTCRLCREHLKSLQQCQQCGELFHARCSGLPLMYQSFLYCRDCRKEKVAHENSETPNDQQTASSSSGPLDEKMKVRANLMERLQFNKEEKLKLEKKVLQLASNLGAQHKLNIKLVRGTEETSDKIAKIRSIVTKFQKAAVIESSEGVKQPPVGAKDTQEAPATIDCDREIKCERPDDVAMDSSESVTMVTAESMTRASPELMRLMDEDRTTCSQPEAIENNNINQAETKHISIKPLSTIDLEDSFDESENTETLEDMVAVHDDSPPAVRIMEPDHQLYNLPLLDDTEEDRDTCLGL